MNRKQVPTVSKKKAALLIMLLSLLGGAVLQTAVSEAMSEAFVYVCWLGLLPLLFLAGERVPFIETGNQTQAVETTENRVRIARKQYARGEIDEQEFERRIENIQDETSYTDEALLLERE